MIDFVQNIYPGLPGFIGLFVGDIMSGLLHQLSEEFHRSYSKFLFPLADISICIYKNMLHCVFINEQING